MEKLINTLANKPFKIFYNGLVPRSIRHQWNFTYIEIPTQKRVSAYWQKVINEYLAGNIEKYDLQAKKNLDNKKIIWQYWGQGLDNLHEMAEVSFASVDKFKDDYEVIRITDENIDEYIEFPSFIKEKRKNPQFRTVFFSDLLRMALINIYGGVWLDATILLTDPIPHEYENYDIFLFSRDPNSINKHWGDKPNMYFNWHENFKVRHLSSIVYGRKKSVASSMILDLLLYFWQTEENIPHYFFFQMMLNELCKMQIEGFDFPIKDDTLPHLLQGKINQKFDKEEYEKIIAQTPMHKLTLHKKLKEKDLFGNLTYFGYLKQNQ